MNHCKDCKHDYPADCSNPIYLEMSNEDRILFWSDHECKLFEKKDIEND